jgi:hypothetical protein
MTRECIAFEATTSNGTFRGRVTGQTAKCLVALVLAGKRGISALDCDTWAYRLAAYCYELRHNWGLVIRTEREDHPGGWHGRHILETPVRIVTSDAAEAGAQHG